MRLVGLSLKMGLAILLLWAIVGFAESALLTDAPVFVCGQCSESSCRATVPILTCPSDLVILDVSVATYGSFSASSSCSCTGTATSSGPCDLSLSENCQCGSAGVDCAPCDASATAAQDLRSVYAECVGKSACYPTRVCSHTWGVNDPCVGAEKTLHLEAVCGSPLALLADGDETEIRDAALAADSGSEILSAAGVFSSPQYVCGSCTTGGGSAIPCYTHTPIVVCPTGQVISDVLTAVFGYFDGSTCDSCGTYPGFASDPGPSPTACPAFACGRANCQCILPTPTGGVCGACSASTVCTEDLVSIYDAACVGQQACSPQTCQYCVSSNLNCGTIFGQNDPCWGQPKTLLVKVQCVSVSSSPTPTVTVSASLTPSRSPSISITGTISVTATITSTPAPTVYVCGSCGDSGSLFPCQKTTPLVACPLNYAIQTIITAQYGVFSFAGTCTCGFYPGTTNTSVVGPCEGLTCTHSGCQCVVPAIGGICGSCPHICTESLVDQYASCVGQRYCYPQSCGSAWGATNPCNGQVKTLLMEVACMPSTPTATAAPSASASTSRTPTASSSNSKSGSTTRSPSPTPVSHTAAASHSQPASQEQGVASPEAIAVGTTASPPGDTLRSVQLGVGIGVGIGGAALLVGVALAVYYCARKPTNPAMPLNAVTYSQNTSMTSYPTGSKSGYSKLVSQSGGSAGSKSGASKSGASKSVGSQMSSSGPISNDDGYTKIQY